MTNSDGYWKDRAIENIYEVMVEAEEAAEEVSKLYLQSSRYIEKQLNDIFERYKKRHGLSTSQAYLMIGQMKDKGDLEELKRLLQSAIDAGDKEEKQKVIAEIESAAYRARMERFVQLQKQIDTIMREVYKQENIANNMLYANLAKESYYKTIFDIQQRCNAAFSFAHIDQKQINKVLSMSWSGKHYSKRIWDNTSFLAEKVKEEMLMSLLTGKTEKEAAGNIQTLFSGGAAKARRLIRTESNYVSTELNFDAYKAAGIEEYQYLATLDLRTSKICQSLDGKIFKVSEHQVGVNCPPMHPWCRSTTISVVNRDYIAKMKRSAIDPATGKKILVPRSMNYAEWYAKYVEGTPQANKTASKAVVVTEAEKKLPKSYADVTDQLKVESVQEPHLVEDMAKYTVNDTTYKVDGRNVKLDYSPKEKAIAELLVKELGGEIKMVPRVLNPQGVSTPDYIFNGEAYDLKELSGTSKNLVYNALSKKGRQASNFVLDVSNCPLDVKEIARQIDYVYWSKHTSFIDKIMVVQNNQLAKIYERTK